MAQRKKRQDRREPLFITVTQRSQNTVTAAQLEKVYTEVEKETNPINWVFPEWRYQDVKLST